MGRGFRTSFSVSDWNFRRVESARSTLVRPMISHDGCHMYTLSQSKNVLTYFVHSNAAALDVSRCHIVEGVKKVDAKRGYSRSSGAVDTMGSLIAAVAGVALVTLAAPWGRVCLMCY